MEVKQNQEQKARRVENDFQGLGSGPGSITTVKMKDFHNHYSQEFCTSGL